MSLTCHPDAILGVPGEKAYPLLRVIVWDGDSWPDVRVAWCGQCGAFWSAPDIYTRGSWEAPQPVAPHKPVGRP